MCYALLDGSDDPPVVQRSDDEVPETWWPTLTRFFFHWVWEHRYYETDQCVLHGFDETLSAQDLAYLGQTLQQRPPTMGQPLFYDFHSADGAQQLYIWPRTSNMTWWWLAGRDEAALLAITRHVWGCGTLAQTLQVVPPWPDCPERVLNMLLLGSSEAIRSLGASDISALVAAGPVQFVVHDGELPLRWLPLDEYVAFWTPELQQHIADPTQRPARAKEAYPGQYYYAAEEWASATEAPLVYLWQPQSLFT